MSGDLPPNQPPGGGSSSGMPPGGGGEPPKMPPGWAPPEAQTGQKSDQAKTTPWEERGTRGWFDALVETIKSSLFSPGEFFGKMPTSGDMGSPILYIVVLGWIGGAIGQIWQYLLGRSMGSILHNINPQIPVGGSTGLGMVIGMIVVLPILILIGLFIGAAIFHVCLMIVGGAKTGFESTVRVLAYSGGSTSLFQIVPLIGPLVGGIWGLVLYIIGFSRANEISGGKAALAVFLPIIVCCACGIGFAVMAQGGKLM